MEKRPWPFHKFAITSITHRSIRATLSSSQSTRGKTKRLHQTYNIKKGFTPSPVEMWFLSRPRGAISRSAKPPKNKPQSWYASSLEYRCSIRSNKPWNPTWGMEFNSRTRFYDMINFAECFSINAMCLRSQLKWVCLPTEYTPSCYSSHHRRGRHCCHGQGGTVLLFAAGIQFLRGCSNLLLVWPTASAIALVALGRIDNEDWRLRRSLRVVDTPERSYFAKKNEGVADSFVRSGDWQTKYRYHYLSAHPHFLDDASSWQRL